jgi:hypothetical protein
MLWETDREKLMALTKYDRIVICLFRHLTLGHTLNSLPYDLHFSKETIVKVMRQAVADGVIDKEVKNVADIKYTYDSRKELPSEVEQAGPRTWLQNGKGKYIFRKTRRKNIIDLADILTEIPLSKTIADVTPQFISELLGTDEQAVFTRVRNAGLLDEALGFKVWPIQGHHRTSVSYGQIEIDEVHAGIDNENVTIVPISGKGGTDKLSWSQALNLNTYGTEKARRAGLGVRSLGLWRDRQNTIWIVEFTPQATIDEIEIERVHRFKFR